MKKRTLKGMTLVEVIVALAIFTMLGVILITLGSTVDKTTRSSNKLNKRVSVQAPYAASKNISYNTVDDDGNPITTDLVANPSSIKVYIDEENDGNPDTITVNRMDGSTEDVDSEVTVSGNRYNTKAIVEGMNNVYNPSDVSNSEHHLQFIDVTGRISINLIDTDALVLGTNETYQITYIDADGNPQNVSGCVWTHKSLDADKVVSIDSDGLIRAKAEGTCIINGYDGDLRRYVITIEVKSS